MNTTADPRSSVDLLATQAAEAFRANDVNTAGLLAERAVGLQPDHAQANHVLGLALLEEQQIGAAFEHLQRATSLQPKSAEYAAHFARVLVRVARTGEALQAANAAAALSPVDPAILLVLGAVYMQCHAFERANAMFRAATALAADDPACHFNYAVTLTFMGEIDQAEAEFEACIALEPGFWRAWGLRSRLRRQTPEHNHTRQLRELLAKHPDNEAVKLELHPALGKELEDLGEFAAAFEHFTLGKAAGKRLRRHASSQDVAIVDAMIRAFPRQQAWSEGYWSREPIFIVGMPRSGTTLVERILSSHPEVHSAGELPNFAQQVERLSGIQGQGLLSPAIIDRARHMDWERLGRCYIDSTRPQTASRPRFIDKLPHNFLYIGFIAQALPHARIICLRRHPMDTCLSNFRESFSPNSSFHGYSFDLLDIGRFHIQFERMMAHWRTVLPGRVLEVDYETLVADQAASTRQLLDHCELPWNDACLHFEQNRSAVATASTTQVREPIYNTSINRWEKYGAALQPLERLLNDAGIATRG